MKRVITFMMALALILSLSVTAFAAGGAGEGSITVSNAVVGGKYSVYKIFEATYNEKGDVTYTIQRGDAFFEDLFGDGTNDYFVYHEATGVVTRNTEVGKSDAELFAYLQNLVKDVDSSINATKTADNEIKFENLPTGYYVIKSEVPGENGEKAVAVSITTAKPDAVVNDKNNLPGGDFEKTFTDGTDSGTANVGDVVSWKLSFTATNYSKEEKVVLYTIKDNLNPEGWAEIDVDSIIVTVDGETLVNNTEWQLISGDGNGFVIEIPWVDSEENFLYPATAKVEVTYSATVLEDASDNSSVNKNKAELEWTLDTGVTPPGTGDETETDVFNIGFTKVDGTNPNKKLSGATFELYGSYNAETKEYSNPIKVSGSAGVYVVDPKGISNEVVTPEDGAVVIKGLEDGTYYLKETKAPDGYNLLTAPVVVTFEADVVDKDGNVTEQKGSNITVGNETYYVNHTAINVENFSGVELPSTGGKGTMMMITIGTMVAMAFAVLLITQKKMSIYED